MSKWQCYSDQKAFLGTTIFNIKESLPVNEQYLLDSTIDTWAHLAPEAAHTLWKRLFEVMTCNFTDIGEDGRHCNACDIYNSRYKEFRNKWYNDKSDRGASLEDEGLCDTGS